jgi:pimeloyl-ACP methyl ester carboxylesterase
MTVIRDLFPGCVEHRLPTESAEIFVRTGRSGPPLLLLHGQTHVCWHQIASELAGHVTPVLADLRGYGRSSAPPGDAEHKTHSKWTMAADCLRVIRALGPALYGGRPNLDGVRRPKVQSWCTELAGGKVKAGHFLAEENPQAMLCWRR